jgi:HlyD family secretion protein
MIPGPLAERCFMAWTGRACLFLALGAGCTDIDPTSVQGYVEGEFVYVASPYPGALERLHVQRGAQVKAGDPLFVLENAPERAARDEAERRLAQARATLEDAKKGKRPSEIAATEAQLSQARAALRLSESEYGRQQRLIGIPGATAELEYERARSTRDRDRQRVAELEAELKTAQLGSRTDLVAAAEANVRAQEAALARAEWDLSQKQQTAPKAGEVLDTLYREGEWVPSGRPVVVLLPPQNIKVRTFVSETRVGAIHLGDPVRVSVDGVSQTFAGRVSFISPRAEYTPPVIYSRESRSKLVFMVEAVFDPDTASRLHAGQPVDVQFGLQNGLQP